MAAAADQWLASLDAPQRAAAVFPWREGERANWDYVPRPRKGLTLKAMTAAQRGLARALLASGLSRHGWEKATNIMTLELILRDLEGGNPGRDQELYYFSIFGRPDPGGTWGWRVEGHHLSVNVTMINGKLFSVTPSFFGSNPAEVKTGPRQGLRILAEEEDLGRQLVASLNDEQKRAAVIAATAPREIITGAQRKVSPLKTAGIAAAQLTSPQRDQLTALIKAYVSRCRTELAEEDWRKIQAAGLDRVYFAWAGGLQRGEGHYYRVQGPTFLLEYDNTQNDANHVHSVWRDFENDFGEDLLRRHYQETPHH